MAPRHNGPVAQTLSVTNHSESSMLSIFRVILFSYMTFMIGLLALHNPFLGYANTETDSHSKDTVRFDSTGPGCQGDASNIWEYYYDRHFMLSRLGAKAQSNKEFDAVAELEKFSVLESPARRKLAEQYNRLCTKTEYFYSPGVTNNFIEWYSKGAFFPWLATGLHLVIFAGAATAIAAMAILLFGRRPHSDA